MIPHWNRLKFRRKPPSWQGNDRALSAITEIITGLVNRRPRCRGIGHYRALQGITGRYRALQGVTGRYRL